VKCAHGLEIIENSPHARRRHGETGEYSLFSVPRSRNSPVATKSVRRSRDRRRCRATPRSPYVATSPGELDGYLRCATYNVLRTRRLLVGARVGARWMQPRPPHVSRRRGPAGHQTRDASEALRHSQWPPTGEAPVCSRVEGRTTAYRHPPDPYDTSNAENKGSHSRARRHASITTRFG
jgi:hypothetical protein